MRAAVAGDLGVRLPELSEEREKISLMVLDPIGRSAQSGALRNGI
jgi:hypothetical protein